MGQRFDVGDVRAVLTDAAVAAGADGMARAVGRTVTASRATDLGDVGSGDLVITTIGALAGADESGAQLVTRLRQAGIAALAIQLDDLRPLDPDLLAAATDTSVPVLTFPDQLGLTEVASAITDAKARRLQRVIEVHDRFRQVALDGGTTSDIVATLHDMIGRPVALVGGDHGEIQVLTDGAALDPDQQLVLEIAAAEIAARQARLAAVLDEHQSFEAITLERLVAGDLTDVEHIAERGAAFEWDLSLPRAVLLASIDPPATDDDVAGALTEIAAAARATLGPSAIVWTRSATVAVLLAPAPHDAADRRRLADGLRQELDRRVRSVTISIGVGRQVDDMASLPDSFQEACRAVDVGRWAKGRHVTEVFDELGLERLFASTPQAELADFVRSAIGPLLEHDRTHDGELVDTLESWLQTRNIAESARRMHVHYNTFKNRLDRIEGILGPVIADAERSLECEVALYVARHYDGPWTRAPETAPVTPAP